MLAIKGPPADHDTQICHLSHLDLDLDLDLSFFMGSILQLYQTVFDYYLSSCHRCNRLLLQRRGHLNWPHTHTHTNSGFGFSND